MKRFTSSISAILTHWEKKRFGTLIILNLVISVADIASLALLVFIVNFYAQPAGSLIPSWLPQGLFNRDSTLLILLFLLFFSCKNYAAWLVNRAQCRFMAAVSSRISQKKLLNYLEGDYQQYSNEDSAKHLRQISFQPLEFCQHILDGVQQIITQAALVLLTIIAILLYNTQLFLLLFVILLPPVIAVFFFIKKRLKTTRIQTRASSEQSLQHLQEALAGFVESNMYNKNEWFLNRYMNWQQQYNRNLANYLLVQATPARVIEIFALLGLFILIMVSQWMMPHANGASLVTLGTFVAAAYKIIPGIVKMLNISGQMNAYEFTIKGLAEKEPNVAKKNTPEEIPVIQSIGFKNVSFHYNHQPVLKKVNFRLSKGDFFGISGASGKGKTTILNLLTGFLSPTEGDIFINDSSASTIERKMYRRHIAYVKQQPFLIHDTIVNNIVLDSVVDEQRLKQAVHLSGLDELIKKFPEKLNKVITENGKNISGGQRQRIALARAFYKDAAVIILDEPFNELDETSENKILSHLEQLAANGRIVIFITHHTKSLSYCTKTLSLDEQPTENAYYSYPGLPG